MQSLDEKTWKPAVVDDIFTTIKATKGKTTGQLIEGDDVPYIAAAKTNNGCAGVYSSKPYPEWVSEGNAIVFVQLGDGAAGLAHYIPMPFIGMSGKTSCGYFQHLNKYNGIFIARCLSANKAIFSHGHSWTGQRLIKTKFMLPVTDSGEPDYEYMAEYTQQKHETMLTKYRAYAEERITELGEYVEIPALYEKEWCEFPLNDIFTVEAGKRLETRNKVPGTRPFIGATDNGNGVTGFVGNDNASKDSNVLGVNYNGAPCIAFYHPYECIFTDDVKRLHLRNYEDNKFVLLFFVSIFAQQRSKYSYGYKFKEQRMLRQKLMLPITDSGEPDYKYMEQYAKNLMLKKYKQYLTFLDYKKDSGDK